MIEPGEIETHLQFLDVPKNVVAFTITKPDEQESLKEVCVIFNASRKEEEVDIPSGDWSVYVNKEKAGIKPLDPIKGGSIKVPSIGAIVLGR